jgi:glutathione synthase/RimK-type ligase-like ATP-grasp enzyme
MKPKTFRHIFLAIIFCTSYLLCNARLAAILPTDITFLAVDLKFDGQNLKVLEFQDGPTAGFRAYDEVFEKGEIWEIFWKQLRALGLPIWYIGPKPHSVNDNGFSHNDKERLSFDYFLKTGGHYVRSLDELQIDELFKRVCGKEDQPSKQKKHFSNIKKYKGILLLKLVWCNAYKIQQFQQQYPGFLIINEKSRRHSANKKATHKLFEKSGLIEFRPKYKVYPKNYGRNLAAKIISDLDCEFFVIKPMDSSRSNGIVVTDKQSLDSTLKKILTANKIRSYRPTQTLTYEYWKKDQNSTFIVEEYTPSKQIMVNGKPYEPTMRSVCFMTCSKGTPHFEVLKSFWKIPEKPLDAASCELTEKLVSKHRNDLSKLNPSDLALSDEDDKKVKVILGTIMNVLYKKMLRH